MSTSGQTYGQSAVASPTTSGPTTVSASFADLAEMSITLTFRGGPVLCEFVGAFTHSSLTGRVDIGLSLDAAGEVGVQSVTDPVVGNLFQVVTMHRFSAAAMAAGSHTIKVRWATSTATATASGTARIFRVTEMAS